MTTGVHQSLNVVICNDAQDAINKGFTYNDGSVSGLQVEHVVIVRNGTEGGHATVDFVMLDPETGKKHVIMITGRLLQQIAQIALPRSH